MKVDFLLVGQGLAGSLLGYELLKRGHSLRIIDPVVENTSSNKAAGLYNPITGRTMVKTWLADELFPMLSNYYQELETELNAQFHHTLPIYRPFYSFEELNDWMGRAHDERFAPYISALRPESMHLSGLVDPFGGIELKHTGFVDLPKLVASFRSFFMSKEVFIQGQVTNETLTVGAEVNFESIQADKVIFCDGVSHEKSLWWNDLPFQPVRGEIIDIKCDLPMDRIYNRGVFMLPKGDVFRVGSTYDRSLLTFEPQLSGIAELEERLKKLFSGKIQVISASAGVRPATTDRKPYIGWHPENKAVGIFNGFGTKGVSLVPYFSKLFADTIERKTHIHPEADVSRVF